MKKLSTNKGLRVAVAGVALVAAGSLALPLAGAAKGGSKGQTGGGTTLVDSPYGIKATDAKYGSTAVLTVTDKASGAALGSLPESMRTHGTCTNGGTLVGSWSNALSGPSYSVGLVNPSLANGASCSAYLAVLRSGAWVDTAVTSFNVLP